MITIDKDKCCHCGLCVGVCPPDAIWLREVVIEVNEACTDCGLCVRGCPVGAIDWQ
jgi:ferredoxin